MKTIGTVLSTTKDGVTAEILTDLGVYGLNKAVRHLIDFKTQVKKGDILLLTIDDANQNTLLGIQKVPLSSSG